MQLNLKNLQNLFGRFLKRCFFIIETVWNFLIEIIGGRIEIIAMQLTST